VAKLGLADLVEEISTADGDAFRAVNFLLMMLTIAQAKL
jgi:hypothetical protein